MRILKAAPGLDSANVLVRALGPGFEVVDFDGSRPLAEQVGGAEVLLLRDVPVTEEVLAAGPRIKLLQRCGQHVVGVDFAAAARRAIPVANVPAEVSGAARDVAEHAFFLLLAVAKRYRQAQASIAAGKMGSPRTEAVAGKTLGLVGLGRIGTELVRFAKGFGMRVVAIKRRPDAALARAVGLDRLDGPDGQDAMLAESDFVSIHLPLEPATVGYFGRPQFARMKKGAYLINIARGPIVDQQALYEALASGQLAGAGLDVFKDEPIDPGDPLLALPNVIATPHHAGHTVDTERRLWAAVADNVRRVAGGLPPSHVVGAGET